MTYTMQARKEPMATTAPESDAGVRVVRRHHLLVRCSHAVYLSQPQAVAAVIEMAARESAK